MEKKYKQKIVSRYGRVQSVKILSSSVSTTTGSSSSSISHTNCNISKVVLPHSKDCHDGAISSLDDGLSSSSSSSTKSSPFHHQHHNYNSFNNLHESKDERNFAENSGNNNNSNCFNTFNTTSNKKSISCCTINSTPNNSASTTNSSTIISSDVSANVQLISICATVSFMDIKSASKAHNSEHKFDDRMLTTEYYEPSSIPQVEQQYNIMTIPNKSINNVNISKKNNLANDLLSKATVIGSGGGGISSGGSGNLNANSNNNVSGVGNSLSLPSVVTQVTHYTSSTIIGRFSSNRG